MQYLHHTFGSAWAEIGPEITDEMAPQSPKCERAPFWPWTDLDPTRDLKP